MTITKDILSTGSENAGFPQQDEINQWIEVTDWCGNSLDPALYACAVCGTVSIPLMETEDQACRVCLLMGVMHDG